LTRKRSANGAMTSRPPRWATKTGFELGIMAEGSKAPLLTSRLKPT
jgi:hypothetical protein